MQWKFLLVTTSLLCVACAAAPPADHAFAAPFLRPGNIVLFQGDSITDGGRWRAGNDFNHIMGQDYAYILAAELGANYPELNLTFLNRGISGNRVVDLAARWRTDTLDLKPDVLSILVGINDTLFSPGGETVEQFRSTYKHLLDETIAVLPDTKIILGEPFLLPVGKHKGNYTAELAEVKQHQDVVRQLAATYHTAFIPYQQVFERACRLAPPEHWSWDGVHPTYAGHALMAQAWLRAAASKWPEAR